VLYDDARMMGGDAAGRSSPAGSSEDVLKRFAAYGWATKQVDGHDPGQIAAALSFALRSKKPTLIACLTAFGFGTPAPSGAAGLHGIPMGLREAEAAKAMLGWHEPPFTIPEDVRTRWHSVGNRGAPARRSWLKRVARHTQRAEFERVIAGRLPDNWREAVNALKQAIAEARPRRSTRTSSQACLEALVPTTPELIGGSANLTGRKVTVVKGTAPVSNGNYGGRYLHFGIREHGMAAAANGMALHGGIIPYIGTFVVFSDYLRPALRMSAIMRQRVIYVLTHDSIGIGEDGPTHQPIEHLASLRAMPNVHVFRPADAMETAECWELAIRRAEGPSVLVLSRQPLPAWRTDMTENRSARGGYLLAEADGPRQATVIATGSEVPIAMAAREKLAGEDIAIAVVSLPSWELFAQQDESYRAQVLGGAPRIGLEAATGFGWNQWIGSDGIFIGMSGFGASAPCQDLYEHFGITPEAVVAAVRRRLG
jgi:transketolase